MSALAARLAALGANRHPVGLPRDAAFGLERALAAGERPEAAARSAGLDPRIGRAVARAAVSDVPGAMARLLGPAAERAEHERRLRGAAFYPAMLAVVVATCGVVVWLASRELFAVLPFDGEPPAPWAPVTGGAGLAGLVALALLTAARVGVPGGVGDRLDGASFLAWASALVEAGAALPEAIRGAGSACGAPGRRAAERMAARLEAGGGALVGGSLLAPTEACMLATGAAAGVAGASLAVLAEHRRRRLEHELAAAVMRVELATLALAALAVLAMGVPFYASYSAALR